MAGVRFDAGHCALLWVPGLRHGSVVKLAFGREEHALRTIRAEPAVMEVEFSKHEELFLAALGEVKASGARP